jgi:hypothetical protein
MRQEKPVARLRAVLTRSRVLGTAVGGAGTGVQRRLLRFWRSIFGAAHLLSRMAFRPIRLDTMALQK